ncbi:MAG: hypothetical protein QXJ68_02155 [Methanocellales archaeon]
MKVQRIELKKGKFEVYKVGNMRFERIFECGESKGERWVGFFEDKDRDIPVFARSKEGFTIDEIRETLKATQKFIEVVKKRSKPE